MGVNVRAKRHLFNDVCEELILLYKTMQDLGSDNFMERVNSVIKKYSLSDSCTFGYKFYGCDSSRGLASYNKEKFCQLRDDFNSLDKSDEMYSLLLYVLIVYSFNNQIRFNSKRKFNLPVGKRDFNKRMKTKLKNFIDEIQKTETTFTSMDFREIKIKSLTSEDFVYVDPPYLITCATYNELGGWTEKDEIDLLTYLDELSENQVKFALSNVLESKGEVNEILQDWVASNPQYLTIQLDYSYKNSNYQKRNKELDTKEVLIVNYKEQI